MPKDIRAGFPVHWMALSKGPAPALLLHCGLANGAAYAALAAALADRLAIIAPDMPGHGRSDDWDGRADIHDQVTGIAASFLTPGTHVIGHSFGATVALRLAMEHPGKVASLTLIEPVLFAAARLSDPETHAAHVARNAPFNAALHAEDWPLAARLFTSSWGNGQDWDDLPERQRAGFVKRIPLIGETHDSLYHDSAGLLSPGRLEAIRAPTLLLRGSDTMAVIAAIHTGLLNRIPDAREVVLAGAGHMAPLSHPGDVAAAIRAHLRAVSPPVQTV